MKEKQVLQMYRGDAVDLFDALQYSGASEWGRGKMIRRLAELIELDKEMAKTGGLSIQEEDDRDGEEQDRLEELLEQVLGSGGDITVVAKRQVTEEPEEEVEEVVEEEGEEEVEEDSPEPEEEEEDDEPEEDEFDEVDGDDEAEEEKPDPEAGIPGESKEEKTGAAKELADALSKVKQAREKIKEEKKAAKEAAREAAGKSKKESRGNNGGSGGIKTLPNRAYFAGVVLKKRGLEDGLSDAIVEEVDKLTEKSNLKTTKIQLGFAWHAINGYLNG